MRHFSNTRKAFFIFIILLFLPALCFSANVPLDQLDSAGCSARVISLCSLGPKKPGDWAMLCAAVKNTGSSALPAGAKVGFWVRGSSIDRIVGYSAVGGLSAGATQWYIFSWNIPRTYKPGTCCYWARVYDGSTPCSDWKGPESFPIVPDVCSSVITSLWEVGTKKPGDTARLWAYVQNTGSSALPAGARVGYWVGAGPSGPNDIVGYVSVAGLAPGAKAWRSFEWKIPTTHKTGTYYYWARVYDGSTPCSDWKGPQNFTVSSTILAAEVISLWPPGTIGCGGTAELWAKVQNTGSVTLPDSARAYYWVGGPSGPSDYVGYVSLGGLAPGATRWVLLKWKVPDKIGEYTYQYWARVWDTGTSAWIGAWKGPQSFANNCIK